MARGNDKRKAKNVRFGEYFNPEKSARAAHSMSSDIFFSLIDTEASFKDPHSLFRTHDFFMSSSSQMQDSKFKGFKQRLVLFLIVYLWIV